MDLLVGMSDEETEYVEGVDFSDVTPILEGLSYPITADELIEEHGDVEIDRTNADPISLRALFDPMGDDTIKSADGARESILSLMPKDSEGRQRYSDRGLTIDDPTGYSERDDRPLPGHDVEDDQE